MTEKLNGGYKQIDTTEFDTIKTYGSDHF